jgi:hypothetical protein
MTEAMIATSFIMALFSLGIALKILIPRRPFLFNGNWLLGFMALAFSPMLIMIITSDMFSDSMGMAVAFVSLLIYAVVLVVFAKLMKGYIAMGVTDDSLRAAIHAALQQLEIPFEETLAHIKLTSLELDLQVSVQSWLGAAQFRVKQSKAEPVLKEITKAIVNYYQTHETKMNNTLAIVYLVCGVLILAGAIILIALRLLL